MDTKTNDRNADSQDSSREEVASRALNVEEAASMQQDGKKKTSKNILKIINKNIFHVATFSVFFNLLLFSSPIYMLQIYNRILPARAEESLLNITLLVVFMLITMGLLDAVRQLVLVRLARQVENAISQRALITALTPPRGDGATFDHHQILRDIDQVRSLLTKSHLLHLFDALWLPVFLIAIALLHPYLAIVASIGVAMLCALGFAGHLVVAPATKTANRSALHGFSIANQMILKADVLRGLGMVPTMARRWDEIREQAAADHMVASQKLGLLSAASKAIKVAFQSIALGAGAYLAIHDAITAGAIVAGSILIGRALSPLENSILAWHEITKAWESYQRLYRLHERDREAQCRVVITPSKGGLLVDNLSCSIDDRPILRDISFEAEPGQLVAIVGPSGSGKTTLARYLVGAWGGSGAVRLDGLDIASMNDEVKRRFVGYLPQECQLFDGTIIETISRFGEPSAEQIIKTAELSGIHEMILGLPNDYGASIGTDGCLLSAGQRQRLALARALYGDPVLIVLDEPCAHLDEDNERSLIQTLQVIKKRGATVCLVTHKLNFLHMADRILVLNAKGRSRFGAPRDLFSNTLRPVPSQARVG